VCRVGNLPERGSPRPSAALDPRPATTRKTSTVMGNSRAGPRKHRPRTTNIKKKGYKVPCFGLVSAQTIVRYVFMGERTPIFTMPHPHRNTFMRLVLQRRTAAHIVPVHASTVAHSHRHKVDVDARSFGQGPQVLRVGGKDVVAVGGKTNESSINRILSPAAAQERARALA